MGSKYVQPCKSYYKKRKWRAPEAQVQNGHVLLLNKKVEKNNKICLNKLDIYVSSAHSIVQIKISMGSYIFKS